MYRSEAYYMSEKYIAYVGSYTHESSKGIHLYDMDVEKGRITERTEFPIDNPSYITLSHSGNFLYSICDQGVTSFSIEPDGSLNKLNVVSINGMRGCHITISKDDRFLIVSGYHDGKLTVLSLDEELLCACDLGIDQIKLYEFNHNTGKLKLYDIIRSQLESAPRQMIFSADGRYAYVLCELKNYINVYSYDKDNGKNRFELIQNIFTVRKGHKTNSAAASLILSNSGNNLICSNAGDNTVTIYSVNKETGTLNSISSLPVSGDYPKYINIFPDDKHIMSMNNEGNSITIFTIHFDKGLIVMNGPELKISKPNNMIIKKLQ